MANINEWKSTLEQLYQRIMQLQEAFKKNAKINNADIQSIQQALNPLKSLCLMNTSMETQYLELSRTTIELIASLCVLRMRLSNQNKYEPTAMEMEDLPVEFERYMNLLFPYYTDMAKILQASILQQELLCLYLLSLLASDRIGELHMIYGRLSQQDQEGEYIKNVMKMERYLMDGSFNMILSQGNAQKKSNNEFSLAFPDSADVFLSKMTETVRILVADSLERAYDSISIQYALKMLNLHTVEELQNFCGDRDARHQRSMSVLESETLNTMGSISTFTAGIGSGSFASAVSFERSELANTRWVLDLKKQILIFDQEKKQLSSHCVLHAAQLVKQLVGHATAIERVI